MGAESSGSASEYALGPGDRIRITVYGHEDLSGEFLINEKGSVALPLAGNLELEGVTVLEAQQMVVNALRPDYLRNPRVGVEVLEYRPFYILGEVNNPGSYPYVNGMTVNEAVAIGGGFTYRARKNRVEVIRAADARRTAQSISVTDSVFPGDVITVQERIF
ncbi:polysaccharide biosynthesis/export family protein [Candidatus Foliamicus sp.]